MLTGNYGFFNLLVILLLVPFLYLKEMDAQPVMINKYVRYGWCFILGVLCFFSVNIIFLSRGDQFLFHKNLFVRHATQFMKQLGLLNRYGLFAQMTTNQTRYNVFLSHDNDYWEPIQLKYYDQFGFPELTFVQPYQPRIRWQLWFSFYVFIINRNGIKNFFMCLQKIH